MAGPGQPSEPSRGVTTTVSAAGVVAVVLLAVGGMVALGVGPLGGPGNSTAPSPVASGGHGGSSGGHVRPFSFTVQQIDRCGSTCRDVTVTLTNNGGHARGGIVVKSWIYAGNDTVWKGSQAIGTLGGGASTTETQRVDVGLVDGAKIKQHGGVVTIVTVVDWDGGSATYRTQRQVA